MSVNRLWLFCPENDIALGQTDQSQSFTPPRAAWQMRLAGEALPLWLGQAGDRFLTYGINDQWLRRVQRDFGIEVEPYADPAAQMAPTPWGWSRYSRRQLLDEGVDARLCPDDEQLDAIRTLSSRATSVAINAALHNAGLPYQLPAVPRLITDTAQLPAPGAQPFVCKALWSSSGRGLLLSNTPGLRQKVAGMIRRAGAVTVEPWLRRAADFAMLFDSCGGDGVKFVGYSVFDTDDRGHYQGNVLGSQEHLVSLLTRYVPRQWLDQTREALLPILDAIIDDTYRGLFGVDMLVYATAQGGYSLAPCVELNLRPTVGHVVLQFSERFLALGRTGMLRVAHGAVGSEYEIADHRLARGILALSPGREFTFVAEC